MVESVKTKVESIHDLIKHLNNVSAKDIEVVHIVTGDKYFIGYQFYWGSQEDLSYLAFINKDTHEIDRIDEDFDEDMFEEISENWTIFVGQ